MLTGAECGEVDGGGAIGEQQELAAATPTGSNNPVASPATPITGVSSSTGSIPLPDIVLPPRLVRSSPSRTLPSTPVNGERKIRVD